jgi:hypothetical protein
VITDEARGASGARLDSFLHLHPRWQIEWHDERLVARADGRAVAIEPFGIDRMRLCFGERDPFQGWYCPEFGKAIAAPVLEITVDRNDGRKFGYLIRSLK